jgi:hypothetical protein
MVPAGSSNMGGGHRLFWHPPRGGEGRGPSIRWRARALPEEEEEEQALPEEEVEGVGVLL